MLDVIIVGAGQAGLAMGYYLRQGNYNFVLLDGEKRIGDSWRNRYDSLQLFTPRGYCALPGMNLNGNQNEFPSKDEIANYLEVYANHFSIPVRLNTDVSKIRKKGHEFEVYTSKEILQAKRVIIASGAFQRPFIPSISQNLSNDIFQIHSSQYQSPKQIPEGPVLVVGGGNSGTQIAVELAESREVTIAVSHPFTFLPLQIMGKSIFAWLEKIGLLYAGTNTRRGRWFHKRKDPIFGFECRELIRQGRITVKPKIVNTLQNKAIFSDDSTCHVQNVVWSTGFIPDYQWIEIEGAVNQAGLPIHTRGISGVKGLYYIGLPWQHQRGSALLCGVGRDAEFVFSMIEREEEELS
ncbi:NAD(P)-binding domain-containing protein [Bacillus sp. Xin]|uniref:flavin-containing monooxygenase n=1 Tax=unclassified Bacillus (in: firmicutes) TaxID=185979 RepID=UPI001573A502|nr:MULTISPECIES: NAD(P)/FAD-dependent oxidoreductase [unclassified Bacillus (in: firmicutes)]MBC6972367.1 NAD(P)-binding domain-containing protein [Bacillus sp. Xin]NSW38356.1 NAD(P)-binding domain-containing protein [Bacillus sp. Xin1]